MRLTMRFVLAIWLGGSVSALAAPPRTSPRPMPREMVSRPAVRVYYRAKVRPRARPARTGIAEAQKSNSAKSPEDQYILARTVPVYRSRRPKTRPTKLGYGSAVAWIKNRAAFAATNRAGSVCADRRILGTTLAPIAAKLPGCGLANPVRVTSIDGIRLSPAAILNCTTAKTLTEWVDQSVRPSVGRRGGGLAALKVAASYSCRTRNSRKGARISEHGKGRAIDISGLTLANGQTITVKQGWNKRRDRRLLSAIRTQACGRFGTVLGPGADRYHRDHFHLDTARYRGGAYCR